MTDEIIAFSPSKPEDGEYMASEVKILVQLGSQLVIEVGLLHIYRIVYFWSEFSNIRQDFAPQKSTFRSSVSQNL